jgi:stage II sporulation protein R
MEKPRFEKWELALCIGLIFSLFIGTASAYADPGIEKKLVRLHIVAASDSREDQELKLKVRDETLAFLDEPLSGVSDIAESFRVIGENIPALEAFLQSYLKESGFDHPVSVTLEREQFPTREYSTFALPAGPYTALRVTLGPGSGENWWCVVFPPLCAASAMERLPDGVSHAAGLSENDVKLITQADESYVVRFKVAEWLGGIKNRFSRK